MATQKDAARSSAMQILDALIEKLPELTAEARERIISELKEELSPEELLRLYRRIAASAEPSGTLPDTTGTSVRLLVLRALDHGELSPHELTTAVRKARPGAKNVPKEIQRLKESGLILWVPTAGGGPRDGVYRRSGKKR